MLAERLDKAWRARRTTARIKPFQENVLKGLIRQAELQLGAAEGQHIIWVFAEKAAEARVEETFSEIPKLHGRIQFVDMPWRVGKI